MHPSPPGSSAAAAPGAGQLEICSTGVAAGESPADHPFWEAFAPYVTRPPTASKTDAEIHEDARSLSASSRDSTRALDGAAAEAEREEHTAWHFFSDAERMTDQNGMQSSIACGNATAMEEDGDFVTLLDEVMGQQRWQSPEEIAKHRHRRGKKLRGKDDTTSSHTLDDNESTELGEAATDRHDGELIPVPETVTGRASSSEMEAVQTISSASALSLRSTSIQKQYHRTYFTSRRDSDASITPASTFSRYIETERKSQWLCWVNGALLVDSARYTQWHGSERQQPPSLDDQPVEGAISLRSTDHGTDEPEHANMYRHVAEVFSVDGTAAFTSSSGECQDMLTETTVHSRNCDTTDQECRNVSMRMGRDLDELSGNGSECSGLIETGIISASHVTSIDQRRLAERLNSDMAYLLWLRNSVPTLFQLLRSCLSRQPPGQARTLLSSLVAYLVKSVLDELNSIILRIDSVGRER